MRPPSTLREWGEWIASLRFEDVPEAVLRAARLQRANTLAACAAGVLGSDAAAAVRAAREMGRGSAIAPPGFRSLTVPGALFAGVALGAAHGSGDHLLLAEPGAAAVVLPLVAGAGAGADGATTLLAQVLANEVAGRLGAACLLGPHFGPVATAPGRVGAAAAAARLLGLSGARAAHALALALFQPGTPRWHGFGTSARLLAAADPAVGGWHAAVLAREGIEGPLDALDAPDGFLAASFAPLRGYLGGLSSAWFTSSLAFHTRPGTSFAQPVLDAFDRLEREGGSGGRIRPEEVRSATVDLSLPAFEAERLLVRGMPGMAERLDPAAVLASVTRLLAVRIARGGLGPEDLTLDALASCAGPAAALAAKTRIAHDWRATFRLMEALGEGAGLDRALSGVPLLEWRHVSRKARDAYGDGLISLLRELPRAAATAPEALRDRALVALAQRVTAVPSAVVEAGQGALRQASSLAARASAFLRTGVVEAAADPPRAGRPPEIAPPEHDVGAYDLGALRLPLAARVEVFLSDGRLLSGESALPAGATGPSGPEAREAVRARWERDVGRLVDEAASRSLWEAVVTAPGGDPEPGALLERLATATGSWPRGRAPRWQAGMG
ncbi:MmgE/PrpD family protein [Myxococcota bacterium]|nr:MmgE/PrpD family protein [Myxococcota bacterium]